MAEPPPMPGLRAVIALSPQAILARGGFAERFGDIRLPTLAVTGTEDVDPYGLVDSPHTRQASFNFMPPGRKYLLVIEDGSHSLLAGGNRPLAAAEDANGPPGDAAGGARHLAAWGAPEDEVTAILADANAGITRPAIPVVCRRSDLTCFYSRPCLPARGNLCG